MKCSYKKYLQKKISRFHAEADDSLKGVTRMIITMVEDFGYTGTHKQSG